MNDKTINDFINFNFSSMSNYLAKISPIEFGAIGSLVGLLISIPLNSNEQNSIGNFLELVGQVVLTVQAQSTFNQNSPSLNEFNNFKKETEEKINYLLKEIKKRNK